MTVFKFVFTAFLLFFAVIISRDLTAGNKVGQSFTAASFPPANWRTERVSILPGGEWVRATSNFKTSPACAESPGSLLADNFLITHAFTPAAGDSLVFWVSSNYVLSALGRLEVKVSTTDNFASSFFDFVLPVQITLSLLTPNVYYRRAVSLNDYAGQQIYIGFRHIEVAGLFGAVRLDGITVGGYNVNLTALVEGHVFSPTPRDRDTVVVSVHEASSPHAMIESHKVFLDTLGFKSINFTMPEHGLSYYLSVRHRNTITTWSKSGGEEFSGDIAYDFTTGINKAYGNNMIVRNGKATFYAADIDQDGFVDGTDNAAIENAAFNFESGDYHLLDINWDGFVDGSDGLFADNNAYNFVGVESP